MCWSGTLPETTLGSSCPPKFYSCLLLLLFAWLREVIWLGRCHLRFARPPFSMFVVALRHRLRYYSHPTLGNHILSPHPWRCGSTPSIVSRVLVAALRSGVRGTNPQRLWVSGAITLEVTEMKHRHHRPGRRWNTTSCDGWMMFRGG